LANQWKEINSILTNPDYHTISQKQHVQTIIYNHYEIWANSQALKFKQLHQYKCKHISKEEIKLYAKIGLHKAIVNYNPLKLKNISFASYALIHIKGEIYKCITELHPITPFSKSERRKGHKYRQHNTSHIHIPAISTNENKYILDDYTNKKYQFQQSFVSYDELWNQINYDLSISNKIKRIIRLKFSYEFDQIRSNKQISELEGCSEETIRQSVLEFKQQFMKNGG